jgi:hypothetical protein
MSEYKTHPACKSSLYFNKQPLKGDSSQVSGPDKAKSEAFLPPATNASALIPARRSELGGMFFCDVYNRANSKFK